MFNVLTDIMSGVEHETTENIAFSTAFSILWNSHDNYLWEERDESLHTDFLSTLHSDLEERRLSKERDICVVVEQTGVSRKKAVVLLDKYKGDIIEAIINYDS